MLCYDGDVRFEIATYVSDTTPDGFQFVEGRVLICDDGEFTAICVNNWDNEDATVACSSLGYPTPLYGQLSKGVFVS